MAVKATNVQTKHAADKLKEDETRNIDLEEGGSCHLISVIGTIQ